MEDVNLFDRLAAAYVRGHSLRTGKPGLQDGWKRGSLEELEKGDIENIIKAGREADLKIYRFKTTHRDMPRIKKVIGFLRGISFESLLDVGSGRGVFLFPFLTEFPWVEVTAVDVLPYRVEFLQDIAAGGLKNLTAMRADICDMPFPEKGGLRNRAAIRPEICDIPFCEKSVDVVTMLEVLEHIPDVGAAVRAAVKMARSFVVATVPSKEDDNPEHIHLLTKEKLTALFAAAGCKRLHFDGVNGHLMVVASLQDGQRGMDSGNGS